MSGPGRKWLPVQDPADTMSLALAYHDLQGVAQCNEPTLTAHRAHLSNVVHIYDCVAVDSLKLLSVKAIANYTQVLGCQ